MLRGTVLVTLLLALPGAASAATITVNSNDDVDDGTCGAHCSLREAIGEANDDAIADEIVFTGAMTIAPAVALPDIVEPVSLNDCDEEAPDPQNIQIDGAAVAFDGLRLVDGSGGSTICNVNVRGFGGAGIYVSGSDGNTITGTRIGTTANGESSDPNETGILIVDSEDTLVEDSLVSGNDNDGIAVLGASSNTAIEDNLIGTDDDGQSAVANGGGVGVAATAVGTVVGPGNVVSGNFDIVGNLGVGIDAETGSVIGNKIGTDIDGVDPLPNGNGVNAKGDTVVGGASAAEGNVISGNANRGVFLAGPATIQGNLIGTAASGLATLTGAAEQDAGVYVTDGATGADVVDNVISGNGSFGIDTVGIAPVTDIAVRGNVIGLGADAATAIPNPVGITLGANVPGIRIGGPLATDANTIGGNSDDGIAVRGEDAVIEGNEIRDNTDDGVVMFSTSSGTLVEDNTVSGNGEYGVVLGQDSEDGTVRGNTITQNTVAGVRLDKTADPVVDDNVIADNGTGLSSAGGLSANPLIEDNTIEGNTFNGAYLASATNLVFRRNHVVGNGWDGVAPDAGITGVQILESTFLDNGELAIDLDHDARTLNDSGDGDTGANNWQNFPVLTDAHTDGSATAVEGTIDTTPGRQVRIELFATDECGDAEDYLGARTVTAGSGATPFSATVDGTSVGRQLTATATDQSTGDTSELSDCREVDRSPEEPPPDESPPEGPPPPAGEAPPPIVVVGPPLLPAPTPPKLPAKLRVLRNGVVDGRLDMLIDITSHAVTPGAELELDYHSAGKHTKFDIPIEGTQIKVRRKLPKAQRGKDTGITTIEYAGNDAVAPDEARLRAADGKSKLVRKTATLVDGVLTVAGTITSRARGVVRVRLAFDRADGTTGFLFWNAKIDDGAWRVRQTLPAEAAAGGQLSIQFTGYEKRELRGEMTAKQVLPSS